MLVLGALPPCEGSVLEAVERAAIQPPMKGSEAYIGPDAETMHAVGESLASVLAQLSKKRQEFVFALERASLAGYELCAEEELILLRPVKAGFGQPVLAI